MQRILEKYVRQDTHRATALGHNTDTLKVLQTGLTPSASGSAYLELQNQPESQSIGSTTSRAPALKLTCTVHGPKPLPRSAPFTPSMLLSTHIKFAPFASCQRRGYLRDSIERDLAVHLETALRGVIISDRWPKSGLDIVITILDGEDDSWWSANLDRHLDGNNGQIPFALMTTLSGCITAASAAIIDAGIDCVDVVSGGVAAIVPAHGHRSNHSSTTGHANLQLILDPCPSEHENIQAACAVGYLKARDEITEVWIQGGIYLSPQGSTASESEVDKLVSGAVKAAAAYSVMIDSINKDF